jgi:hypothetical protein
LVLTDRLKGILQHRMPVITLESLLLKPEGTLAGQAHYVTIIGRAELLSETSEGYSLPIPTARGLPFPASRGSTTAPTPPVFLAVVSTLS